MAYVSCTIEEIEMGACSRGGFVYDCWLHLKSANRRFTVFDMDNLTQEGDLSVGQNIRALIVVGIYERFKVAKRPLEFQVDSGSNQFCGELLGRADLPALLEGCRITASMVDIFLERVYIRVETEIGGIYLLRGWPLSRINKTSTSKHPAFVRLVDPRLDLIGLV